MAKRSKAKKHNEDETPEPVYQSELARTRAEINKGHGEGTLVTAENMPDFNLIPTGVFILDLAMFGGWQEGVGHMTYGMESAGKTHLLLKAVAEFQRKYPDKWAAWIAAEGEGSFDKRWAAKNGVDTSRLEVSYPKTGNQGVDVYIAMMTTLEVGLVVGDSIPSFIPQQILSKSAEDDTQGELARLMSKFNSKILGAWMDERTRGHRVTSFLVNQYRYKIGKVAYGDGKTLPGGRQINHMPNTKLRLNADKAAKKVDEDGEKKGDSNAPTRTHRWKLEKVRFPESILEGEYEMNFSPSHPYLKTGQPDDIPVVALYAKKYSLIEGGGTSWKIPAITEERFRKREEIEAFLRENPPLLDQLKRVTIMAHRQAYELEPLPPDGYLVAPVERVARAEAKPRRRR